MPRLSRKGNWREFCLSKVHLVWGGYVLHLAQNAPADTTVDSYVVNKFLLESNKYHKFEIDTLIEDYKTIK